MLLPVNLTASQNLSICYNTSTTLLAQGVGQLGWYSAQIGGTYLGAGASFNTGALTNTTTFYVQDSTCSATRTPISVTVYSSLLAYIDTLSNTTCNGGADGLISLSVNGGSGALNYMWTNGMSTSSISGLSAGIHTCTISDTNTCSIILSDTITEPTPIFSYISSSSNVSCNGGTNAAMSLSTNGSVGVLNYTWSNGTSTPSISGLSAGIYTCTIVDSNACFIIVSDTITEPAVISSYVSSSSNVSCNGATDGAISLTASGGSGALNYMWANGMSTSAISGLSAGIYTCTILDSNACSMIVSYTITEPATINTNIFVNGFTLSVNEPGASFQWINCDNGNLLIPNEDSSSFTPISNGNYAVVISLGNCSDTSNCENITGLYINKTLPLQISLSPNPTKKNIYLDFNGNSETLTIMLYNSLGQLINTNIVKKSNYHLTLPQETGVYWVIIKLNEQYKSFKIIKI